MILVDRIFSPGQLVMPVLTMARNMNFLPKLLKLNQNNKQKFSQGIKLPTITGLIDVVNT